MESFREILMAGGHANSLGRANEVLAAVESSPLRMDELFSCITAEDAWVRMRAIDTFEKLVRNNPGLAGPYLPSIFSDLMKSTQPSIQWHLAQIFTEVELNRQQQVDATAWLKNNISSSDVDWIVSANTMKALMHFYEAGLITKAELEPLFTIQTKHASKSVRKKARVFLQEVLHYSAL